MRERKDIKAENHEKFFPEDIKVIILAGGKGTRLSSVTKNLIPKAMVELAPGVKAVDHLIDGLYGAGFRDYLFCLGDHHEQLLNHISNNKKVEHFEYTLEKKLLGTGGAIMLAIDEYKICKPALIVTSDAIFPYGKLLNLVNAHKRGTITWAVSSVAESKMVEHFNYLVKYSDNSIVGHVTGGWIDQGRVKSLCNICSVGVLLDGGHGVIDPDLFRKEFKLFQRMCGFKKKICLYTNLLPMLSEQNRRRITNGQSSIINAYDEKEPILDFGRPDRLFIAREKLKADL